MSWIFHEPLEPAIYARRTVGAPMSSVLAFAPHGRIGEALAAAGVWRDAPWPSQRRVFAPIKTVPKAAFSSTRWFYGLDLFCEEPSTPHRRTFAPIHAVLPATHRAYSSAGRVLATLMATGVYDDTPEPSPRQRQFQTGHTPVVDIGFSASFSVSFTGRGDDPYGAIGMASAAGQALGPDTMRELAIQNPATFSGTSASRAV